MRVVAVVLKIAQLARKNNYFLSFFVGWAKRSVPTKQIKKQNSGQLKYCPEFFLCVYFCAAVTAGVTTAVVVNTLLLPPNI